MSEICQHNFSEKNILDNVFDLFLALDDLISFGYRDSFSLNSIIDSIAMESEEEIQYKTIMTQKILKAQLKAKTYIK